jgi:hypothetical protein
VRAAPLPISARAATIVTVPSPPMDTNTLGLFTTPFGMAVPPVG